MIRPDRTPTTLPVGRTAVRLILLMLAAAVLIALLSIYPFEQLQFWGWDVSVFRAGAKALLHGSNPYLAQNVVAFSDGAELASIPYFVYAPFFALLIAPLALVPPEIATRIWFVFNLACLLTAAILSLRLTDWLPEPKRLALLALAVAIYPPTRTLLVIGQSSGLMLLLLVLAVRLIRSGRPVLGGISLALATFKPHLLLIPLFLALRRQWKALAAVAATLAILSLPFVSLADDWVRALVETRSVNLGYGCVDFSSLNMLLRCLSVGSIGQLAILGLISGTAVWLVRHPVDPTSFRFLLQLGLVVGLGLMIIDNVRVADLVLLILPALIALRAATPAVPRWGRLATTGLLLSVLAGPYLVQGYGAAVGEPLLFELPIWYAGLAAAVFLALAIPLALLPPSAENPVG